MELITVFTPTYNRKELLKRCYQCLIDQTSYNFKWLIIDDGSTDKTGDEVKKWIESETRFKIDYVYKENGGLYTTYNTDSNNGRVVYSNRIVGNFSRSYRLYAWLDSGYSENAVNSFDFYLNLYAYNS